jgi:hypothetical protein
VCFVVVVVVCVFCVCVDSMLKFDSLIYRH